MYSCIPEHVGSADCPECGENHSICDLLPEGLLTVPECNQVARERNIDELIPIYEIHKTDEDGYYTTVTPAIIMINSSSVAVLWCDPNEAKEWVYIMEEEEISHPMGLANLLKERLQQSAFDERVVDGFEVVMRDVDQIEL